MTNHGLLLSRVFAEAVTLSALTTVFPFRARVDESTSLYDPSRLRASESNF